MLSHPNKIRGLHTPTVGFALHMPTHIQNPVMFIQLHMRPELYVTVPLRAWLQALRFKNQHDTYWNWGIGAGIFFSASGCCCLVWFTRLQPDPWDKFWLLCWVIFYFLSDQIHSAHAQSYKLIILTTNFNQSVRHCST